MRFPNNSHQEKEQEAGKSGGNGGKIEWKLSEFNAMAVSRRQWIDRRVQDGGGWCD